MSAVYTHSAREFYEHKPPLRVSDAFEGRAAPKMVALLVDQQDLNLRREAMFSMLRYTKSNPQNIVKCVEAGAVKLLVQLMRHEDTVLRRSACKLVGRLSSHLIGFQEVLRENGMRNLLGKLNDPDEQCRQEVYTTLVALTDKQEGAQNCIDNRGVPMLVEKLKLGSNPVIEPLVLQALYQCLMTDAAQMEALLAGGMETMAALISADENQSADVQRWATKNISQLSIPYAAKSKALQCGVPKHLAKLLKGNDPDLQLVAANALMSITIDVEAKKVALEIDLVSTLVRNLYQKKNDALLIASIKCLENIAEESRPMVLDALSVLRMLTLEHPSGLIKKYAQQAIDIIRWTP